jgi:hypothetical protein
MVSNLRAYSVYHYLSTAVLQMWHSLETEFYAIVKFLVDQLRRPPGLAAACRHTSIESKS